MKKYKCLLEKIILLLITIIIVTTNVTAQDHVSKDNYTGNWEDIGTWAIGDGNINNGDIINIYGYVKRNSDLSINNLSVLNVIDTLIIYGNLTIGNNGNLNIISGGILIVYGNATMDNRVDIDLDSYFVVFGDYNQGNNSTIDAPADDTLLYVTGGTSCGGGGTICPDADLVGDEDDLFDNPDLDEIIEATSNFITPRVPTFCAGGSVVLSIRDDGDPGSYEWFETSDPTTILSTVPTLTVTAEGTYDVYFEIVGVEQAVTAVNVSSSGTATHSVTGVVTNESGVGAGDGEIDITVIGASNPIYDWSNGETTEDIIDLSAGDYTVEVEDNGCRVTESFSVGDGSCTDPSLSTITSPEICNGFSYDLTNIVVVDANSTSPTYTYHSGTPALPGNELGSTTVSPTTTTTYYILGTNGSCTDELPVDVTVNPLPTANDQNPEVCSAVAGENASAIVNLTLLETSINNDGGVTYTWYSDAALTIDITATANAQTIAKTINGGAVSATEDYYCVVSDGVCTNTATVTYLIYRTPDTGPQFHLDDTWGN